MIGLINPGQRACSTVAEVAQQQLIHPACASEPQKVLRPVGQKAKLADDQRLFDDMGRQLRAVVQQLLHPSQRRSAFGVLHVKVAVAVVDVRQLVDANPLLALLVLAITEQPSGEQVVLVALFDEAGHLANPGRPCGLTSGGEDLRLVHQLPRKDRRIVDVSHAGQAVASSQQALQVLAVHRPGLFVAVKLFLRQARVGKARPAQVHGHAAVVFPVV